MYYKVIAAASVVSSKTLNFNVGLGREFESRIFWFILMV